MSKYPGYRTMNGAARYNARMDRLWNNAMRAKQLVEARKLSDDEVRRHASIATDNGPFDATDTSFTTACELVRRERGLPHLHAEESAA